MLKIKQHWEPVTGKSNQAKFPLKPINFHKYIVAEILQVTTGCDLRHQLYWSWPKTQNKHNLDGGKAQNKFMTISSKFPSKLQLSKQTSSSSCPF